MRRRTRGGFFLLQRNSPSVKFARSSGRKKIKGLEVKGGEAPLTYSLQYGNYSIERRMRAFNLPLSVVPLRCLPPQPPGNCAKTLPSSQKREEKRKKNTQEPPSFSPLARFGEEKGGGSIRGRRPSPHRRGRGYTPQPSQLRTSLFPFFFLFFRGVGLCAFAGEGKMEVRGNGGEKEKEEGVRRSVKKKRGRSLLSLFSLQGLLAQSRERNPQARAEINLYSEAEALPPPSRKKAQR